MKTFGYLLLPALVLPLTGCLIVGEGALHAPDAPDSVVAQADDSEAVVRWRKPFSGGHFIKGYRASAVEDSTKWCESATLTGCVVTGLTGGLPYTFVVKARNKAGWSPLSQPSPAVTPTNLPPFASSWTQRSSTTTRELESVVWTGSKLYAVGNSGAVTTSFEGVTWYARWFGGTTSLARIAWGGGSLIALGAWSYGAPTPLLKSTNDGTTFSLRTTGATGPLHAVTWGTPSSGGTWVVVGEGGTILTSPDGDTWTPRDAGDFYSLGSVTWDGTRFIAFSRYHGSILTSPDGITWTKGANFSGDIISLASADGVTMAVGMDHSATGVFVMSSSDGVNWTRRNLDEPNFYAQQIIRAGTRWVILGSSVSVLTSIHGEIWARRNYSDGSIRLNSIAWTGTRLVGVGGSGTVMLSP